VEFKILGTLDVVDGDDSVVPGGLRPRTLLAALLLRPNEVLSVDRLADAVWRGGPPPSAVNSLHTYVTRLRHLLEPDRPRGDAGRVLVSHPTGYSIRVDAARLDALRFEALAGEGRAAVSTGDAQVGAELLAEALGLWRGTALPEFAAEPFAQGRLAQLEERRLIVIEDLVATRLDLGRHDELDGELEHLVAEHPLRERLCELWMLALYRAGRQADALRACRALRDRLRDELGITPRRAVVDLEHAILAQSPTLDRRRPVAGTAAATNSPTTAAPLIDDRTGRHARARRPGGSGTLAETATERGPTATMTFLFTDIEGSARLWETAPDVMSRCLPRHDALVRDAIERHGGRVFATGGDGFAAAFSGADDAVAAARAAQRALTSETGIEGFDLRIRIGMHTGAAEERGGDYFGSAVNRAARIMAAGHGGQVLASQATVSTLGDARGLTDLGRHRLRDLLAPEHLFLVDGRASDHPPLRTLDAHDHNLPVLRSAVFGIDETIDDVAAKLAVHGMVTLTGMGGVGKTRLAVEVAARAMADHDVTRFVDLTRVADGVNVVSMVAATLGVETPDLDAIVSYLAVRDSLLVLDNCEHVIDAVCDVLEVVLARCPDCAVLATSREPLGVDGEHVQPVRSLPLDRAVEMFVDRAAAVRPDLTLDDQSSRAHIEEICSRLDGIPLALELAAARVTHMTPADIVARLDERFVLLSGGRRRARQRQQTLKAAMDWSYELLDADEQSLLRTVAVFAGGFDADAAAAIWDRELIATLDVLGALVERSLLVTAPEADTSRYTPLETVRLYAQERLLSEGEAQRRRAAHADYYLGRLRSLDADVLAKNMVLQGNFSPSGSGDLENYLAALDWFDEAGQLDRVAEMAWRVLMAHFHFTCPSWADERDRYLGRRDVIDGCDTVDRTLYLAASAVNANIFGRWHDQLDFATLGLDTATGPVRVLLLMVASVAAASQRPDMVARLIDEALHIADDEDTRRFLRVLRIGDELIMTGQLDRAHAALHEMRNKTMSSVGRAPVCDDLAFVELILGYDDHVIEVASKPEAFMWPGRAYAALAVIAARAGDQQTSAAHLIRAAASLDAGIRLLEHDFTIAAALCSVHLGEPEHACRLLTTVPGLGRTESSYALLIHTRRLVREHLDRDTVAAIRTEMADVDPVAVRREELHRLRAITAS
jgi:predicted ATPase/DNA-binding SARP family transcriptional activator